jgi:hypothetical protein
MFQTKNPILATLRELISASAKAVILNHVSDQDEDFQIVEALQGNCFPTLFDLLESDNTQIKIRSLALLQTIAKGKNEIISTLKNKLQHEENRFIQIYIAEIISAVNTSNSEAALINLYLENPDLHWVCLHGLMAPKTPGADSRKVICFEARYDPDCKIRNLVRTLLRDKTWAEPFYLDLLLEQTQDPDPTVRSGALTVMNDYIKESKPCQSRVKRLLDDSNSTVRRLAASMIDGSDYQEMEPRLFELLNSPFESVKIRAFAAHGIASFTTSPRKLCQAIARVLRENSVQTDLPDTSEKTTTTFMDLCLILLRYKEEFPESKMILEDLFCFSSTDESCHKVILDVLELWEKTD